MAYRNGLHCLAVLVIIEIRVVQTVQTTEGAQSDRFRPQQSKPQSRPQTKIRNTGIGIDSSVAFVGGLAFKERTAVNDTELDEEKDAESELVETYCTSAAV